MSKKLEDLYRGLGEEPAPPEGLAPRIVKALGTPRKERTVVVRRFALAGVVLLSLLFALRPQEAQAFGIAEVRRSFESALHYTIRSYRVENGKRTPVAETVVEPSKVETFFIDAAGKRQPLSVEIERLSQNLAKRLSEMDPEILSEPGAMQSLLQDASGHRPLVVAPQGVAPQAIDIEELTKQLAELTRQLSDLAEQLEKLQKSTAGGSLAFTGEANLRFLEQMLSESDLWERLPDANIAGAPHRHFSLKGESPRFDIYIDPKTRLPRRSRLEFILAGQSVITENDYTYRTSP